MVAGSCSAARFAVLPSLQPFPGLFHLQAAKNICKLNKPVVFDENSAFESKTHEGSFGKHQGENFQQSRDRII